MKQKKSRMNNMFLFFNVDFYLQLKKKSEENFSMASMLRERLSQMWDRLEIAEEERKAFLAKNIGFKPKVLKAVSK